MTVMDFGRRLRFPPRQQQMPRGYRNPYAPSPVYQQRFDRYAPMMPQDGGGGYGNQNMGPIFGGGMGQVTPTNIPFRDQGYGAPMRSQNLIQSLSGPNNLMNPYRRDTTLNMLDRFRGGGGGGYPSPYAPSPFYQQSGGGKGGRAEDPIFGGGYPSPEVPANPTDKRADENWFDYHERVGTTQEQGDAAREAAQGRNAELEGTSDEAWFKKMFPGETYTPPGGAQQEPSAGSAAYESQIANLMERQGKTYEEAVAHNASAVTQGGDLNSDGFVTNEEWRQFKNPATSASSGSPTPDADGRYTYNHPTYGPMSGLTMDGYRQMEIEAAEDQAAAGEQLPSTFTSSEFAEAAGKGTFKQFDPSGLQQQIDALQNRQTQTFDASEIEKRLASLEGLGSMGGAADPFDPSGLQQRLSALEGKGTFDPSRLQGRLAELEGREIPQFNPFDPSQLQARLRQLEGAEGPDLSGYLTAADLPDYAAPDLSNYLTYQGMESAIQNDPRLRGARGLQGLQGLQGQAGQVGQVGQVGQQGEQGLQGLQGLIGEQGLQGLIGEQGLQGLQGLMGQQGLQGLPGLTGMAPPPRMASIPPPRRSSLPPALSNEEWLARYNTGFARGGRVGAAQPNLNGMLDQLNSRRA